MAANGVTTPRPKPLRAVVWVRSIAGGICLCSVLAIGLVTKHYWGRITLSELHTQLSTYQGYAMAAFLVVWLMRPLGFTLPMSLLSMAGGYVFGGVLGAAANCAGINLGALVAFMVARVLGRDVVEALVGTRTERYLRGVWAHPIATLFLLRIMPIFSFTVVSALSGVLDIRARHYVTGTALGTLPAAIVYAACGAHLRNGIGSAFWTFLLFSLTMVLLPVVLYYLHPAVRKKINAILCLEQQDGTLVDADRTATE